MPTLEIPPLYAILDPEQIAGRDAAKVLHDLLAGGAKFLQLRVKALPPNEFFDLARRARTETRSHGCKLIINDRVDIALACDADGVHLGQEDLPLFVTAVSIQSSSGGNLREILDGLSMTIRERGKLKRKVRAISTEGRMSAYILTAVPCLLGAAIMVLMPHFYTSVWNEPMTWYLLGASIAWLMLGNAMMFKMSNFKF